MNLPPSINVECNVTNILNELYRDLAQPGVRSIGKALGTALDLSNTILFPIKLLNERVRMITQRNFEDYRKRLESIPEDEICDVNPAVAIPILDKFTYITDDDLRHLYVNLLYSASWRKTDHLAHPSSVKIIDSLSPDEARILNHLRTAGTIPFLRLFLKPEGLGNVEIRKYKFLTAIEHKVSLVYPDNLCLYLDNFIALGLYQYNPGDHLVNDAPYVKLRDTYDVFLKRLEDDIKTNRPKHMLDVRNELLKRSAIGDRFVETCCTGN